MSETSRSGHLDWWRQATPEARRALTTASFGWLLDSFDVMLYALVLASLILDLGISKQTAGVLGSITLLAAAAGGLAFDVIADRYGRVRALIGSVLIHALFTAACGFAQNIVQLALFRILLASVWLANGRAARRSYLRRGPTNSAARRSESCRAPGPIAMLSQLWSPVSSCRGKAGAVFFVGILPSFFTLAVRRRVAESEIWKRGTALPREGPMHGFRRIFQSDLRPVTIAITLMNACTLFAWWGFNLWVPAYLSLPRDRGGIGLSAHAMSGTVIAMQAGMWLGYVSFGFLSDVFGRRRCYVLYLISAALLMFFYARVHTSWLLIALGPLVAFFGTGYYTGFAAVTAEIYETRIRATAQGFAYNAGRIASAAAPFAVGSMAQQHGFGGAFAIAGTAFVIAALCWVWIPETKGRPLA